MKLFIKRQSVHPQKGSGLAIWSLDGSSADLLLSPLQPSVIVVHKKNPESLISVRKL